ncbi:MAG: YicC/YloC family endoribonuclease [Clostridia bacterium]
MLRSMTGYGRAQSADENISVLVEIKSVNHRYFEFSARVPRLYGFLEDKLKGYVQSRVARGKIDMGVYIETLAAKNASVHLDMALAQAYIAALTPLTEVPELKNDVSVMSVARLPDVMNVTHDELDEEAVWETVQVAAAEAVDRFIAAREQEGERLRADILAKAESILRRVETIEARSPQTVAEYRQRMLDHMYAVLGESPDEQRVLTEAAIYADKVAVDEETVRLRSHFQQLQEILSTDEAVGRRLDFLVQEMNRETNTIGSKAQDVEIVRAVLDIKSDIEKIREQIQNVE